MKTNTILLIISLIIFNLGLNAQDNQVVTDTSTIKKGTILVVPFQFGQYFVNNDAFLCKGSNVSSKELEGLIRSSLSDKMVGTVSRYGNTEAVSEKKEKDGEYSLMDRLYKGTIYKPQQKPLVARYEEKPNKSSKNLWGLQGEKSIGKNDLNFLKSKSAKVKNHTYFQAVVKDTTLLRRFEKEYGVRTFLFINHFEMETHFKDCHDIQQQVSQRDMYVHYTVVDVTGKFKNGGVVCTSFHSGTNNIKEILKSTLPSISNMILTEVKPVL